MLELAVESEPVDTVGTRLVATRGPTERELIKVGALDKTVCFDDEVGKIFVELSDLVLEDTELRDATEEALFDDGRASEGPFEAKLFGVARFESVLSEKVNLGIVEL